MKAIFYEKQGEANKVLKIADIPIPQPQNGEVRVAIKTSAPNPSDVKNRAGLRGPMPFPRIIPHSDGAGVIDKVGKGVNTNRIGENIWTYNAAFKRNHGTAAQYVCLPQHLAVPFNDKLINFKQAATFGIPAQTAMQAVLAGGDLNGKYVLVTGGAGAVGYYAIQFAKYANAKVITTVSSDEKAKHAKSAGAHEVVNYKLDNCQDKIMQFTQNQGINHIIEVELGGNMPLTEKIIANHGSIATYGSENVKQPNIPFYPLMFKNITLRWIFVYLLSQQQRSQTIQALNQFIQNNKLITPIHSIFTPEQTPEAHQQVETNSKIGNIIIQF